MVKSQTYERYISRGCRRMVGGRIKQKMAMGYGSKFLQPWSLDEA